jgi:DNA-binding transcriptional MerR regulator
MEAVQTPQIPDRLFFRIGDVSELTGVETYVLRFWESEFPMLSPKKTSSGQRQYRRKDVETVLEIKRLLYAEGYTIAGARKAIREQTKRKRKAGPEVAATKKSQPVLFSPQPGLDGIKKELQGILNLLAKN